MSFFDEVETTVANTRMLQAMDDNAPVDLKLPDIKDIPDVVAKETAELKVTDLIKPKTTGNYLWNKFLVQQKEKVIVDFFDSYNSFRKLHRSERLEAAKKLFDQFLRQKEDASSAAMMSMPNSVGEVSLRETKGEREEKTPGDGMVSAEPTEKKEESTKETLHDKLVKFDNGASIDAVQKMLGSADSLDSTAFDDLAKVICSMLEPTLAQFKKDPIFEMHCKMVKYADRQVRLEDMRQFRTIGRGAFGAVSAVQKMDTMAIFAMKEMNKKMVKSGQSEWMCNNEKKVLSMMNSNFVLGLKYSFHNADSLFLVFEMCSGGDLKFHLRNERDGRFSKERAKFYAAEVLLGLEHIHSFNIVYRDLKPNNILLQKTGHVIISDLGLAIKIREDKVLKHLAGTAGYWAPEIITKTGTYKASDWWSFGVFLYEMLVGKRPACRCEKKSPEWCPFGQSASMETNALLEGAGKHLRLEVTYPPEFLVPEAVDLLKKLFEVDPMKRISATEIKAHPYFASINFHKLYYLEVNPPWVPDSRTVNAESIGEVGEFNKSKLKKIKITPEDEKEYESFTYTNKVALQEELCEALYKLDNPPPARNRPDNLNSDSCCCSLM